MLSKAGSPLVYTGLVATPSPGTFNVVPKGVEPYRAVLGGPPPSPWAEPEPCQGIEPWAFSLPWRCSTTELTRHDAETRLDTGPFPSQAVLLPDAPDRYRNDCLHHLCEPHEGIEPSSTPYEGAVLPLN